MPVIGYLGSGSPDEFVGRLRAFRQGLSETGYVEGENVAIEYRWANNQHDRLPALAADLVNRRVAVIVTTAGTPTIRAAKAATSIIPIVFVIGGDPARMQGCRDGITYFGGNTAIASISNNAPGRASCGTPIVVLAGGAAVFTYLSRTSR
jgi:putative ABC transport system substrate-binding protein